MMCHKMLQSIPDSYKIIIQKYLIKSIRSTTHISNDSILDHNLLNLTIYSQAIPINININTFTVPSPNTQALCLGPNKLKICAFMSPVIRCFMIVLFPLSYPIAKVLEWLVGHEEQSFSKPTLTAFLKSQNKALHQHEINMSTGAINLSRRKVGVLMLRKIFKLYEDTVLTLPILNKIKRKGYSRIPIYNSQDQCVRLLITKSMLFSTDFLNRKLVDCPFKFHYPVPVSSQNNAYQALMRMKNHKTSILMVVEKDSVGLSNFEKNLKNLSTIDPSGKNMIVKNIVGVICLKDIFEDILQEELEDQDPHLDSLVPNQLQHGKNSFHESNLIELGNVRDSKRENLI